MTMLKKALLASVAVSVMAGFVGCSEDGGTPTATPKPAGSGVAKLIDSWVNGPEFGTVTMSNETDTSFSAIMTREKADAATEHWPTASVAGKLTTKSFDNMTNIIVTYSVNKINAAADGVAFYLASGDALELGGSTYGGFRAVLTAGKTDTAPFTLATDFVDTLTPADFFLDWGYDDAAAMTGAGYKVDTLYAGTDSMEVQCTVDKNLAVLKNIKGIGVMIENDNTVGPDTLDVTIKSIKVVGASL